MWIPLAAPTRLTWFWGWFTQPPTTCTLVIWITNPPAGVASSAQSSNGSEAWSSHQKPLNVGRLAVSLPSRSFRVLPPTWRNSPMIQPPKVLNLAPKPSSAILSPPPPAVDCPNVLVYPLCCNNEPIAYLPTGPLAGCPSPLPGLIPSGS